jgi:hypothetical protein
MNTKDYLNEEIARLYNKMAELDPISEEYGKLEARWKELVNQKLEFDKHESQTKETRKDRVTRCTTDLIKVGVPLAASIAMTFIAYAAEAKGVVPFGIGKKWADKLTKY